MNCNTISKSFMGMKIMVVKPDVLYYNNDLGKSFRLSDKKGDDNLLIKSTIYMTEKLFYKLEKEIYKC